MAPSAVVAALLLLIAPGAAVHTVPVTGTMQQKLAVDAQVPLLALARNTAAAATGFHPLVGAPRITGSMSTMAVPASKTEQTPAAPEQGFSGPMVQHVDGETHISDWQKEYGHPTAAPAVDAGKPGPSQGQPGYKSAGSRSVAGLATVAAVVAALLVQ
mmetsp:Transcript_77784/g.168237  ORF Transcript_77784/g.168237 Transcript_77784/m.168237 type:complete len:158 (-) Transcript_77784:143-616(-)